MSNVISNGLIGTHPIVTTFKRDTSEALTIKLENVLKLMNQSDEVTQVAPGFWNVNVALKGQFSNDWKYKQITLSANATATTPIITVAQTDYDAIETGSYYQNLTTGEIYFVNGKVYESSEYHLYTDRGLFGTTAVAQTASDVLVQFNTIVMDSTDSSETLGKIELTGATAVMANGDKFIININGEINEYTMKTTASADNEITVGSTLAAQATNIATKLATVYTDYDITTSSAKVVLQQKTGKGAPIAQTLVATIEGSGTFTSSTVTNGVAAVYKSGYGQMFFTPMPMPGFGQKFFSNE